MKLLGLLLVLAISYFQFKNWVLIHEENMQAVIGAAYGVFDGTPHWRAFQNRIFSPGLVYALGFISDRPFILFMAAGIFTLNCVLYGLVLRLTGSVARAVLAVQGAVLMWIFQHHFWFYSWDLTEALCLLLFTYAALTDKMNRGVLAALVLVSMLNKETAVLIGVYFMVRGAAEKWAGRPINYRMIGQGAALSIASLIVTEALRHYLFKFSSLDGVGARHRACGLWQPLQLWQELGDADALCAAPLGLLPDHRVLCDRTDQPGDTGHQGAQYQSDGLERCAGRLRTGTVGIWRDR